MKSKETKRMEAIERQVRYDALTKKQKIARAKSRPGECKRELKKLMK